MAHSLDKLQGTLDMNVWFLVGTAKVRNAEIFASNYENRIRAENGINLRAYYTDTVYKGAELLNGNNALKPTNFHFNNSSVPSIPLRMIIPINR